MDFDKCARVKVNCCNAKICINEDMTNRKCNYAYIKYTFIHGNTGHNICSIFNLKYIIYT